MRRVVSFATVFLSAALAACSTLRDVSSPRMLSGADAQSWIDADAAAMLGARHPGVTIGPSHCPFLLNLTGGRTQDCTIPVDGLPLRIRIAFEDGTFVQRDVDGLVEKSDAERQIAQSLGMTYGVPFTARCDGPAVRVVPIRESFTCAISAPTIWADRDVVHVIDRDGSIEPERLPSGDTAIARAFGIDVADRREGSADLDGAAVERFIASQIGGPEQHAELVRRHLIGRAQCPKRVFVEQGRSERCTIALGRTRASVPVSFSDGNGLEFRPPSVAVVPALRDFAERYFAIRDRGVGNFAPIAVDCGRTDVIVIDAGGFVRCSVRAGAFSDRFGFDIGDATGRFQLRDLQ